MNSNKTWPLVFILICCFIPVFSLQAEIFSFNQIIISNFSINEISEELTNDFSPMLFVGFLFLVVATLVILGIGFALTLIAVFILLGLALAGLLSTSIIIGLHKKSLEKGFKSFVVIGAIILGTFGGCIITVVLNMIQHYTSMFFAGLVGALSGLLGGLLIGYLAFYAIKKVATWFVLEVRKQQN